MMAAECTKQTENAALNRKPEGKILVVYYSQSEKRNTEHAARWIQNQIGGELFEITMVKPYSGSYSDVLRDSKKDLDGKIDPAINPFPGNIADYDLIFVGSPIWFGTFAPPVSTFLHSSGFAGRTVIPFCTHGGGGAGRFYKDVEQAAPNAKILSGLTMSAGSAVKYAKERGADDKGSPAEVIQWLNEIFQ